MNCDSTNLTRYRLLNRHHEYTGVWMDFAREDLKLWLYSTVNNQNEYCPGNHSGYGSEEELEKDKKYLHSMGVVLIDTGYLQKVGRTDDINCNNCKWFIPEDYKHGEDEVFPCDSTNRHVKRHITVLDWQKIELTPANVANRCPGFTLQD